MRLGPRDKWLLHTGTRLLLETCVRETHRGSYYRAAGLHRPGPAKRQPLGGGETAALACQAAAAAAERWCAEPAPKLGRWPELELADDADLGEQQNLRRATGRHSRNECQWRCSASHWHRSVISCEDGRRTSHSAVLMSPVNAGVVPPGSTLQFNSPLAWVSNTLSAPPPL